MSHRQHPRPFFRAAATSILLLLAHSPGGAQDVVTFQNDNNRSGVQANEQVLTPTTVNASRFGKILTFSVSGDVYAQPLYVSNLTMPDGKAHNVLFVATQQDLVYAFDADGKNPSAGYLWRTSLLGSGETWVSFNDIATDDIDPDIGVTGTPVIDRTSTTLYVITKSKTTSGNVIVFTQRLHALSLLNGSEKLNGPTVISATLPGKGNGGTSVSFDAFRNSQRSGLLLAPTPGGKSASSVFINWASHGDEGTYHGWVISYNAANISQQTGVWVDTPNGRRGGIWMSGGGLATDGLGNIFGASGNGSFDANTGGPDYGDSLFKLQASASGLALLDYFTPLDQLRLENADEDFGTAGPVLLPTQSGPTPHLIVTAGKTGQIYLINRDSLGHFNSNANPDLQEFDAGGYGIVSNFAFFNNQLYLCPNGGPVETWTFNSSTGQFGSIPSSKSTHTFGCQGCNGAGSNLDISANGIQDGIVWALDNGKFGVGPAVLYAYDSSNLARELYDTAQAATNRDQGPVAVKFVAPTVANGHVYVAGRNAVVGYGLLAGTVAVTAAPSFSPSGGTYTSSQTVIISDATPAATIYYTTNGSTPNTSSTVYAKPLTITATTTLQAIATASGQTTSPISTATYTITTGGGSGTVSYGNGFASSSLALNGSAKLSGARLRLTDSGTAEASSAFYPALLNVQNFITDFSFQLTSPKADGMAFVIQNVGTTALGLAGSGLGYGANTAGGSGGISKSVAVKFDLYNNAGEGPDSTGLYKNGASPTLPATGLTSSGIDLHSGNVFRVHAVYAGATLTVTLTDSVTGRTASQNYALNIPDTVGATQAYVGFSAGTGGSTATQDILTWTYSPQQATSGTPNYPNGFSTGNLTLNNGAVLSASKLRLTDGGAGELRGAFYSAPVNVQHFTSQFTFQLTNAKADGMTFIIQGVGPTALDSTGGAGGLGYGPDKPGGAAGLAKSVAVKFDLYSNAGEGTNSTGLYTNGASPTIPATDLSRSGVNLHSGDVFLVSLGYNGTTLTVSITDTVTHAIATQSYSVNIPAIVGANTGYVGFTAASGGLTATQDILTWTYSN